MFEITEEKARQVVQGLHIPAQPRLLKQIQQEQQQAAPDISRIAQLIAADVGLSANVLKAINSPLFGLGRTITDIHQSVLLLGLQNVITLVNFYAMRNLIAGDASVSLERFWDTAVETARIMVAVLNQLQLKRECPAEDAYALGLFHDCGLALMAMRYPDYKEVLMAANAATDRQIIDFEEEHYKTNHAVVGYFVASSWHLPKHICGLILTHHDLGFLDKSPATESDLDLYGILKIAVNVHHGYRRGREHNEWTQVKERVLFHFGLTEHDYEDLQADVLDEFVG